MRCKLSCFPHRSKSTKGGVFVSANDSVISQGSLEEDEGDDEALEQKVGTEQELCNDGCVETEKKKILLPETKKLLPETKASLTKTNATNNIVNHSSNGTPFTISKKCCKEDSVTVLQSFVEDKSLHGKYTCKKTALSLPLIPLRPAANDGNTVITSASTVATLSSCSSPKTARDADIDSTFRKLCKSPVNGKTCINVGRNSNCLKIPTEFEAKTGYATKFLGPLKKKMVPSSVRSSVANRKVSSSWISLAEISNTCDDTEGSCFDCFDIAQCHSSSSFLSYSQLSFQGSSVGSHSFLLARKALASSFPSQKSLFESTETLEGEDFAALFGDDYNNIDNNNSEKEKVAGNRHFPFHEANETSACASTLASSATLACGSTLGSSATLQSSLALPTTHGNEIRSKQQDCGQKHAQYNLPLVKSPSQIEKQLKNAHRVHSPFNVMKSSMLANMLPERQLSGDSLSLMFGPSGRNKPKKGGIGILCSHTRSRIRRRQQKDWTDELAEEIFDDFDDDELPLITEEELELCRATAWVPKGADIPDFDNLPMGYATAWDIGKKGCVAMTTGSMRPGGGNKSLLSRWRHSRTKLRFFIMDGTDPVNFLMYYTKSDMQLIKGEKSEKRGSISAQVLRDAEWSYSNSKISFTHYSLDKTESYKVTMEAIPSHFFIAILISLREMEIYRKVRAFKVERRMQLEEQKQMDILIRMQRRRLPQGGSRSPSVMRSAAGAFTPHGHFNKNRAIYNFNSKDSRDTVTSSPAFSADQLSLHQHPPLRNCSEVAEGLGKPVTSLPDSSRPACRRRTAPQATMHAPDTARVIANLRQQQLKVNNTGNKSSGHKILLPANFARDNRNGGNKPARQPSPAAWGKRTLASIHIPKGVGNNNKSSLLSTH